MVTAEFVNVSVVRCVPPAIARPTTVPFSVAHDYEHGSPLPALRIDPDTGRAVGGVTSGASRGRALGWHPHTWGWHAADETGGEAADDTADVALGLGGDNQRSKQPALWAEPTAFTFYDPHSPPSADAATPPWTFNPLVISPPGEADAEAQGGGNQRSATATPPEHGPTRVVVAGANFVPTTHLACYFGDEQAAWLGVA